MMNFNLLSFSLSKRKVTSNYSKGDQSHFVSVVLEHKRAKNLLKSLMVVLLSTFTFFSATSQTTSVELCVDLSCQPSVTAPSVFGAFNGWCANCNFVTDPDNDGIYCATVQMTPGDQEYKFFFQEEGEETLTPGLPCTVTNFGFTNRVITVGDVPLSETYGWETCDPTCGTPPALQDITLCVDLSCFTSITAPSVFGAFNGWNAGANPITDPDNDGVYCATVQMIDGDQEYKFFFQEEGEEGLTPGDPCTVTNFGFTNRVVTVAGMPLTETYGWEVCGPACVPPPPGPDLCITFDDPTIDYNLVTFAGAVTAIVVDPTDPGNNVGSTFNVPGAAPFAGTVVGNNGLENPIPFTATEQKLTVRVWSPAAGIPVMLKVENTANGGIFSEAVTNTTVSMTWETLVFDYSTGNPPLNLANTYDKVVIFFNFFGDPALNVESNVYYWDDICFCPPSTVALVCPPTGMVEGCSAADAPPFANLDELIAAGGSATDANPNSLIVVNEVESGSCPVTVVRTYQVSDLCGNVATCEHTVLVDDTTPPTFTLPADATLECIDDPDDLSITGEVTDATDNCTTTSSVWINEFHYDNAGTDTGEFIELAGAAGTNLSSYQLVLYNGANGLVYNTNNLSGVIPNEGSGFGAIHFDYPTNGIQNGAPDGICLVQNGIVIEFISYEGSFTASNGPATGMTSTNIGVSETSGTPVGFSLQLTGFGTSSGDFTWIPPSQQSPGLINSAQSIYLSIDYEDESDVTTCNGGTILRTWTVTDACGNASDQVQTIIVNPPAGPEITCPADMTVECVGDIETNFDDATVTTDCDLGFTGYVTQPDVTGAQNCPGTTYTYTYKVIDDCGRTNSCQQVYTIENDPPTIEVIPGETVLCYEDIVVDVTDATVTTACGDDFDLKILPPVLDGIHECPGTTYTYTYRVRDNCGREVTADRVFTIGNNAPPSIVAPPDMTVSCDFNANLNPDYAEVVTGCTLGFTTTVSGPTTSGAANCPGSTYTYTYTVTDDCGRTASDVRTFTIANDAPTFLNCPAVPLQLNCEDEGWENVIQAWLASVQAESACGDVLNVSNNYNPNTQGLCINNGTRVVRFFATDACGRTSSCEGMIIVADTEAPIFVTPPADELVVCNYITQDKLDAWVDAHGGAEVEDCWDNVSWSTFPNNPTINCEGNNSPTSLTVTFVATDGCGNKSSMDATFTALPAMNGSGNDAEDIAAADKLQLFQNQPNPFKNETLISFYLPSDMEATIVIYDVAGKELKRVQDDYAKGNNNLSVSSSELNTKGILFYQLTTSIGSVTKRMILVD